MEGRSRWQEKPNPYGRIYYPDGDQPHYPPGAGEIRSGTPEPTGYSLVCRQSPDGLGSIRFLTKDGKVYNPETKKYMGKLEDFQPQKPTEEELEQATRWLKEKFKIP
jgi:hypothetical protein